MLQLQYDRLLWMEQLPIWPQGNLQNQSFHLDFWMNQLQRGNDRAETHRSGKSGVGERRGDLRLLITSNLIERRSDFFCFFDPLRLVVFSVRTPALSAL